MVCFTRLHHIHMTLHQSIITIFIRRKTLWGWTFSKENQIQDFGEKNIPQQKLRNFTQKISKSCLIIGKKTLEIMANIQRNKIYLFIFWKIKWINKNGKYLWLYLIETFEKKRTSCVVKWCWTLKKKRRQKRIQTLANNYLFFPHGLIISIIYCENYEWIKILSRPTLLSLDLRTEHWCISC